MLDTSVSSNTFVGKVMQNGFSLSKVVVNEDAPDRGAYYQVLSKEFHHCFREGYRGYLFEASKPDHDLLHYLQEGRVPYIVDVKHIKELHTHDVITVNSTTGVIQRVYNHHTYDNALVLTNACNNNCIFCPDSEAVRRSNKAIDVDWISALLQNVPPAIPCLTITGGEPTLLKADFFRVLELCRGFESTVFTLLSNGRVFSIKSFLDRFVETVPQNTVIAIPLHAPNADNHDKLTQVRGAFEQTVAGIQALLSKGIRVEIRIVVNKANCESLEAIVDLILAKFKGTYRVCFIGLEMLGNAAVNAQNVWVDYAEYAFLFPALCRKLISGGINARIYNIPLCQLPKAVWHLAEKSITGSKVRYKPECIACSLKTMCGGLFFAGDNLRNTVVYPQSE